MDPAQAEPASVSVVIPCYLCAGTITRAVHSVAAQTQLPAEVILIDDASPDDTLERLHALARDYPDGWIKVVSQAANRGPSAARNRGWDMATSDYVAFLDADDSWHPRKIEIQYQWMIDHPEATYSFHPAQIALQDVRWDDLDLPFEAWRVKRLRILLKNGMNTPSVMIHRDAPYRFDESKRVSEDYLLWLQIILGGGQAWGLPLTLSRVYKPVFGAGGLTGDLWAMQRGQIDTYRKLRRQGLISSVELAPLLAWSSVKFLRRLLVVALRKSVNSNSRP